MVRNALIAAGNAGRSGLIPPVAALLDDPSPVVRGAAVWALGRLDRAMLERERRARLAAEEDENVRGEWELSAPLSVG